jgi:ABC-2 type transport system ATP-binding protein
MDNEVAIKVKNLSKTFLLPHEKHASVKSAFVNFYRKRTYETQKALDDVSFEVKKGEFFGIVGRNGSGKSTLLKLLAGIYSPTRGNITVNGSLTPFIELGVGFNPELTGRENVYLNGALLGFNRKEMGSMYKDIVDFAELERFMDQKLKNYSSGMQVRLAFSIAIRAKSNILLIDEVLAVGDAIFQQKCYNYFHQLKKEGRTVVFVSHDINALNQYCSNGILIDNGESVTIGPIDKVLNKYTDLISRLETEKNTYSNTRSKESDKRRGTGKATVSRIEILDSEHKEKTVFGDKDDEIVIRVQFVGHENLEAPVYGITINDVSGTKILVSNNLWMSQKSKNLSTDSRQEVVWTIPNIFNTGEYYISPAVADTFGKEIYDWVDNMKVFRVRKKLTSSALVNPVHKISL